VAIDAVTRGDPQRLRAALERLGLQQGSVYSNDVGGWLPVSQIESAAALAEVHSLRASLSRVRAVAVTSQGDFAQGSAALRTTYPTLNGAGVTVGILSDSFNCYGVYDQPGSGVPASGTQGYAPASQAMTRPSMSRTAICPLPSTFWRKRAACSTGRRSGCRSRTKAGP